MTDNAAVKVTWASPEIPQRAEPDADLSPRHRPGEITGSVRWPDVHTMLSPAFAVGPSRHIKYLWRLMVTRQARRQLLTALSDMPAARALFIERPRAFYPVMNHLLDRRFDAAQRLLSTLHSWRAMRAVSRSDARFDDLVTRGLELSQLQGDLRLVLSLNGVSFHEGLWQVAVLAADGSRLYSLGFGFTAPDEILIGNLQGPSTGESGPALIRTLTHASEGLWPPWLLLQVLRMLAQLWGVSLLVGVDPDHHVKGRWNLRKSRLRFDYRAFWAECGGVRLVSGNWKLPVQVEQRALADVPAKRRAMYRRRYEMLARIQAQVCDFFAPDSPTFCKSSAHQCPA
jgi:uncharacterized protein VirK/YbjX